MLVALVIIGIVAALVISPLINTYVESSTVAKVKKALSTVAQAKKLAETQNGPIIGWDFQGGNNFTSASQIWSYLKPHISVAKDCGANGDECYQAETRYLKGDIYKTVQSSSSYRFILSDGSVMWLSSDASKCEGVRPTTSNPAFTNVCGSFGIDVNGNKPPNTIGKDKFYFYLTVDGVYPIDYLDCRKTGDGWGCASYIIKNSNMNYLH